MTTLEPRMQLSNRYIVYYMRNKLVNFINIHCDYFNEFTTNQQPPAELSAF